MRITFLGTGAGIPTRERNVSSVAVRLSQSAETWLFDCGEGTQHRIIESDVRLGQITRIFISHLHGDHLFGLPGLLSTCWMNGPEKMIEVCGPQSVRSYLEQALLRSGTGFAYPARIREIAPWETIMYGDITLTAAPLAHRIETFGYRIEEKQRSGRFDVERARELGVPPGPLYGRLKEGGSITLEDGRVVDGRELCGPPRPGRSIVYCCDTIYTPDAVELARGADLLIHEATFSNRDTDLAEQRGHSTTGMAARVAAEAGVGRLVITHISPRYSPLGETGPAELLREAREIFPDTEIAHDLMTLEIPPRPPSP